MQAQPFCFGRCLFMEKDVFRKQKHVSNRKMPFENKSMFQKEIRLSKTAPCLCSPSLSVLEGACLWRKSYFENNGMFQIERRISQTTAYFKKKYAFRKQVLFSKRNVHFANSLLFYHIQSNQKITKSKKIPLKSLDKNKGARYIHFILFH